MSKISDAKLTVTAIQAYWKRCVVLATGFARRYHNDLFLRTEVNIIALQVAYAAFILLLAIGAIVILYHEILGAVAAAVVTALTTTSAFTSAHIVEQLQAALARDVIAVTSLIFAATAVFGYLVARLALAPTRNALTSQKQFIGNIAHELRTPLAVIKTNTEVRLLEKDIPVGARKVLESNLEELDRISDIINNLLSLNSLVRPEQTSFAPVDVGVVVRRVVEKLSSLASKKPIRIRVRIEAGAIALGNATAIEQIATNVLKNAIQHTLTGEIVITAGLDAHRMLELSVRDTGMGIRREDLFRIFEPFFRGDRARTRTGGAGIGLGLAIVSELVRLHRGRVSVKSAPGRGTTVTITLPRDTRSIPHGASEPNEVFADFSNGRVVQG